MRPNPAVLLALLVTAAGCASDGGGDGGTSDGTGAGSPEASVGLEDDHALVGRLVVDTEDPSQPEVTVTGEERSFTVPVGEPATHHELPVVGLRAEHTYDIEVTVGDASEDLQLETDPLPDEIPPIEVVRSEPDSMASGFTVFNLLDLTPPPTDEDGEPVPPEEPPVGGILLAVDAEGEVVWYLRDPHPIGDTRQLGDGTIFHEYNDTGARIVDLFGNVQQEWAGRIISGPLAEDQFGRQVAGDDAIEVDTDSMHHEVAPLPNGNIVALSTELRTWEGFDEPLCDEILGFDGTYELISDVVVEFTPEGEIVAEHPLADLFDPVNDPTVQNLCGLPQDQVFPNWLYRAQGFEEANDWTHSNAVVPFPERDAFLVSIRHLDALIAIDRGTGELLWRFGPDGDFAMEGDGEFSYHQHAPEWQEDGTLLVYDNGNQRPGTSPDPTSDLPLSPSRAVLYRLDDSGPRDSWSAEQLWEYEVTVDGEPAFAPFVGDADRLANGNVLITNGGFGADRPDGVTAQIVEVVPDDDAEGGSPAFELRMRDDRDWAIYRAERFESLDGS